MDLSNIDVTAACDKPFEYEIKHPVTGEGVGTFILIVGKDSKIYQNAIRASIAVDENEALAASRLGTKIVAKSLSVREAENIDFIVAATTGWRNMTYTSKSGKVLGDADFSADNARILYTEQIEVRRQVIAAINNLANFMKG
jgi:hypothetical protein